MLQEYFDCEFCAYDDGWDGEEVNESFGCSHRRNRTHVCILEDPTTLEEQDYIFLESKKAAL